MNIKCLNFTNRAKDFYDIGELQKAYALFEKALSYADDKEKIDIFYYQALIQDELGNVELALEIFKKIFYLDLDEAGALYGVAMEYEKLGMNNLSERFYRYCIDIDPDYDRAYFFLANLLDMEKRFDEAIVNYRKTIELSPDDFMAYNNLGAIYENIDEYELALQSLDKSIEINSQYFRPYFNKGVVYGRLHKFEEAEKWYFKSLEKKEDYSFTYLNLSALYIDKEMYNKSIEILTKGIAKAKDNIENLYYNRACSYMKIGQRDLALKDLAESVRLNEGIKEYASKDSDFDEIEKDQRFIDIIGEYYDNIEDRRRNWRNEKIRWDFM